VAGLTSRAARHPCVKPVENLAVDSEQQAVHSEKACCDIGLDLVRDILSSIYVETKGINWPFISQYSSHRNILFM
jgi:hypothetical protein